MSTKTGPRDIPVQGNPTKPLYDFPKIDVFPTDFLYRAHAFDKSPWWFSSSGEGRFDLTAGPYGTCYLANNIRTTVRERIGEPLVKAGFIHTDDARRMCVSRLILPAVTSLADLNDEMGKSATFGVTSELTTIAPYDLCQTWAQQFADSRHGGIYYRPRFDPARNAVSLAIFGDRGARASSSKWREDPAKIAGLEAAALAGIEVRGTPRINTLTVVKPRPASA